MITDAIALIACNPENDSILLVDHLAASTIGPYIAIRGPPLAIHIDGLGATKLVGLNSKRRIILHHLKDIFKRLKFTYDNLARTFGRGPGFGEVIDQLYDLTISPWLVLVLYLVEEVLRVQRVVLWGILRPEHFEMQLLLCCCKGDLTRLRISSIV